MTADPTIAAVSSHDNHGTPPLRWLIWAAAVVDAAFHTW
jgi:hypothetical protein